MLSKLIPQKIKNIKHFFNAHYYNIKYGKPSKKLKIIGVTGTDGKTTTANIIHTLLKLDNKKVGLISTINAKIGSKKYPLAFHVTNPKPKDLQNFLKMMVDEKLEYVILETTSHGLDQYRVAGIKYQYAVYTNITHEHLDYHKTYDNYLKTKGKLINYTDKNGTVVLNKDDSSFDYLFNLANNLERKIITYGFSKNTNIHSDEIVTEKKYMSFNLEIEGKKYTFNTNLKGRYNISNIMASIAVAKDIGIGVEKIKRSLTKIPQLEGRWEVLQEKPFKIIIDFAHTPNSLENVLKRASQFKIKTNKLIVVFGCAGKRDYKKRSQMGKIAGLYTDSIILTAEDPRGESVIDINKQIIQGIQENTNAHTKEYFSIVDRTEAIQKALEISNKDDVVLITGKGHEKSMNLDGTNELPWSDKKTTLKLIKDLKK